MDIGVFVTGRVPGPVYK